MAIRFRSARSSDERAIGGSPRRAVSAARLATGARTKAANRARRVILRREGEILVMNLVFPNTEDSSDCAFGAGTQLDILSRPRLRLSRAHARIPSPGTERVRLKDQPLLLNIWSK